MNHIESILQRKSIRHYQAKAMTASLHENVNELILNTGAGPYGHSPKIQILKVKDSAGTEHKNFASYGMIKGAEQFLGAAIHNQKQELVDLGYVLEKLVLALTALNLGTCWLGGTFKKDKIESIFATEFGMKPDEYVPYLIPYGVPADKPRFMDKLIKKFAKSDQRKPLDELFFNVKGDATRVDLSSWWGKALHAIQIAPSSQNIQPWRISFDSTHQQFDFYIIGSSYVDLGIAMCHFEFAAETYGVVGKWVDKELKPVDEGVEYVLSWEKTAEEGVDEPTLTH